MARKMKERKDLIGKITTINGKECVISGAFERIWDNKNHDDLFGKPVVSVMGNDKVGNLVRADILSDELIAK